MNDFLKRRLHAAESSGKDWASQGALMGGILGLGHGLAHAPSLETYLLKNPEFLKLLAKKSLIGGALGGIGLGALGVAKGSILGQ